MNKLPYILKMQNQVMASFFVLGFSTPFLNLKTFNGFPVLLGSRQTPLALEYLSGPISLYLSPYLILSPLLDWSPFIFSYSHGLGHVPRSAPLSSHSLEHLFFHSFIDSFIQPPIIHPFNNLLSIFLLPKGISITFIILM